MRSPDHLYEYLSTGEELLYTRPEEDLVDDPDEAVVAELREKLFTTVGEEFESAGQRGDVDDSIEANLRELGYIE